MKTHVSLRNKLRKPLPTEFANDDVRYAEELVEYLLREFTQSGDVVFDPFMGFGTTLIVAERLDRIAFGVEFDEKRWQYVQSVVLHPQRALHGDSTKLDQLDLPDFNFSITSPPYMGRHHKENPFTAYSTEGKGYGEYLSTLRNIYRQLNHKLKPGGHAVIEVANLKHDDAPITTLAWDIALEVSQVMTFLGEVVVLWDPSYGYGYDHSYCLVFSKKT